MVDIILDIILIPSLLLASYTDIRKREIPLGLFPSAVAIYCVISALMGTRINVDHLLSCLFVTFPLFLLCLAGKMGGGDLIMMACIAFILGMNAMFSLVCFVIAVCLIALFVIGDLDGVIPLAPIITISYILNFVWRMIHV